MGRLGRVVGRGPAHETRGNAVRATAKKSVLGSATGALALSLLLAGCTGTGSDGAADESSSPEGGQGASASSSDGGSTDLTGALAPLTTCDDAGALLGDLVADLALQEAQSSSTEAASTCAWSSDASDASDIRVIALQLQRQELSAEQIATQADTAAEQIGGSVVDDERAERFDGAALTGTTEAAGLAVSIGSAVTPAGVVVVSATGSGDAPLTPEASLDAAFLFVE